MAMEQVRRAPATNTARRLFFALWPDTSLRHSIEQLAAALPLPRGARHTRPERYHLTVQFLGDFDPLPEPMLAAILSAADSVRAGCFELSLDRVDSFEGSRVVWLGAGSVPGGLADLHDALGAALQSAGVRLKPPTPFVPHITVQRNMRTPLLAMDVLALPWTVRDFVLVQSVPGWAEPYRIVKRWPLMGR